MNPKFQEKMSAFAGLEADKKKNILLDILNDIKPIDDFFLDQFDLINSIPEPSNTLLDTVYENILQGLEKIDGKEKELAEEKLNKAHDYIVALQQKEAQEKSEEDVESLLEGI